MTLRFLNYKFNTLRILQLQNPTAFGFKFMIIFFLCEDYALLCCSYYCDAYTHIYTFCVGGAGIEALQV